MRRLGPALQEHEAWIHKIQTILICRTMPADDDLAPSAHLASNLGRWFRDEANEYIRRNPEHAAAAEHHRRIHVIARKLCRAVRDGAEIRPADYALFVDAVGRFDKSIELLAKGLWEVLRHIDPLTGMSTRFAMLPRLKQERERIRRTGHPCSIAMVDLDLFKDINDTYGHQAGDAVLEAVSEYFLRNLRKYDQIYRYGGEEFILVLPDTSPDAARPVVDRLRAGLARLTIPIPDGRRLHVTASFGIAPLAPDVPVADSIAKADNAMYSAKQAGRNLVWIWHESP
ncbi:MAG: diguanylate cyclase [Rhodospirillales bacterium]